MDNSPELSENLDEIKHMLKDDVAYLIGVFISQRTHHSANFLIQGLWEGHTEAIIDIRLGKPDCESYNNAPGYMGEIKEGQIC